MEKHPDIVALGSAFSKVFIAASSKSIKTLSGAAFGRSDNNLSRNCFNVFFVLFGKNPYTQAGAIREPEFERCTADKRFLGSI